jgi:hypothetical protein
MATRTKDGNEEREAVEPQDLNDIPGVRDESGDAGKAMEPMEGVIMPGASAVVDDMIAQIYRWMEEDGGGGPDAVARIVADTWGAQTVHEVMAGKEATHARDILGVPIHVHRVTFVESDVEGEDNCPVYAVFHCRRGDIRDDDVVTCGGWRVVAQAARLRHLGELPRLVRIVNARKTAKQGKMPLKMENVLS